MSSYIKMRAGDVQKLALDQVCKIKKYRKIKHIVAVANVRANSEFWRHVLIIPYLLEKIGWLSPKTDKQIDISLEYRLYHIAYHSEFMTCGRIFDMAKDSQDAFVNVSMENYTDMTTSIDLD